MAMAKSDGFFGHERQALDEDSCDPLGSLKKDQEVEQKQQQKSERSERSTKTTACRTLRRFERWGGERKGEGKTFVITDPRAAHGRVHAQLCDADVVSFSSS